MKSIKQIAGAIIGIDFVPKRKLELEKETFASATQDYVDTIHDLKREIERLNNRRFCFVVTFEDNSEETIQADGFKDYAGILSFYANERGHYITHEHDVYATKKKWKKIKEIPTDD